VSISFIYTGMFGVSSECLL